MTALRAFVVIGLGYGDEGKGSVVDWLTREHGADLVVRFNGGAQAAHHVVDDEGREHAFSMFGSGTFAGVRTYLSEHVLVDPLALAVEANQLMTLGVEGPLERILVHVSSPLVTPFHVALNRLRELSRGTERHGSCGRGIGETQLDVIRGVEMRYGDLWREGWQLKLRAVQSRLAATASNLSIGNWNWSRARTDAAAREIEVLRAAWALENTIEVFETVKATVRSVHGMPLHSGTVVFEGAQGVLLDEAWGFHPHTTWSTTTGANARQVLRDTCKDYEVTTLGVVRAFATRHGAGPLPTQIGGGHGGSWLAGEHNMTNDWQEKFRVGWPDAVATRYAALADGALDGLVVTCSDRLEMSLVPLATFYRGDVRLDSDLRQGRLPRGTGATLERTLLLLQNADPSYEAVDAGELPHRLAAAAGVPLYAVSRGPKAADKQLAQEVAV